MKDYIKSKIAGFSIYSFFIILIVPFWGIPFGLIKLLYSFISGYKTINIGIIIIILFLISLYLLLIGFLKHIKYIVIKENRLKYWSLFIPFGRTLYFDNYIGKIIQTESGSGGSYKVVYLVNKKRKTAFKIMGLHYKNFDDMNDAIPLKKIGFSPSTGQYFKLLFFERITIHDKKAIKQTESKNQGHSIAKIFAVISAIGVALFALGMLVKIIVKLLT
jgi:hypothetical protein